MQRSGPTTSSAFGTATRRQLLAATGAAIAAAVLAACGSDSTSSSSPSPTTTTGAATTGSAPASVAPTTPAAASFPVTITHAFGDTTIEAKPGRVVVVGYKEQDYFLALGVVPIAIREWFGGQPGAVWPWAQSYLGGAVPEVLPRAELNYERIAQLQPDVIVGLSSGMTRDQYDLLAKIAPTVAQLSGAGDYTMTWQEATTAAGQIVGEQAKAAELVAGLEARIAQVPVDHPQLVGRSTALASAAGGQLYLYGPGATASLVLTSFGLTMSDEIARLTDNADAYYIVSSEQLDVLDVDVAVWSEAADDEGIQALLAMPLYQTLDVAREGREVFLGDLNGAMVFSSVLSLPIVLDEVVPKLVLAVDGDPSTKS